MRRPPATAKRDKNEPDIVAAIRAQGIAVFYLQQPLDLLCSFGGFNYLVEVKDGHKAKLTPFQVKFLAEWPGQKVILRTTQDADNWARGVRRAGHAGLQFEGIIS